MDVPKRIVEISSLAFFAWLSLIVGFRIVVDLIISPAVAITDLIVRNLPLGAYLPILIVSSVRFLVGIGFVLIWLYAWKRLSEWYFWSRFERSRQLSTA